MGKSDVKTAPFSYTKYRGVAPHGYKCGECGATDVKLWREWNTFLDHQTLRCFKCACGGVEKKTDTDMIEHPKAGSLAPAVPTEDGQTYWGYTSVPALGVIWWKRLDGPKWTAVEILDFYKNWMGMKEDFEKSLAESKTEEQKAYYQGLLDSTIEGIDAVWLDVTGQF